MAEQAHVVVQDLGHTEELREELGDEGERRADPEVGDARPDPRENCEASCEHEFEKGGEANVRVKEALS